MSLRAVVYNGVKVFELTVQDQKQIMRRTTDNYVNATHILTIAGLSKGQRTKALEIYAAENDHVDKVQGGYGISAAFTLTIEVATKALGFH